MHRHRHDPSKTLVGFIVGDVEYAVAIERVKEIANPLEVVALPHAPDSVVGVADYRGDVVPVVDLRTRFGLSSAATTRKTKWIVVEVGDGAPQREAGVRQDERLVALVVDSVTEVFGTGGADMRAPPSLGGGTPPGNRSGHDARKDPRIRPRHGAPARPDRAARRRRANWTRSCG